ncbi:MAG: hypothetical protein NDJ89_05080 [Oligoflexia bacterium]|nr:hypothetical protein [Oligoflexia bacterium]
MLAVKRGHVLVYRLFDVAEEIDLIKVEKILRKELGELRLRPARTAGQAFVMRNAPLRLQLGQGELEGAGPFECRGTVWDYGVLSIQLRFPLAAGTSFAELPQIAERLGSDGAVSREIDEFSRRKSLELSEVLSEALKLPERREVFEDYVIYFFEELQGARTGSELLASADLPALILAEQREPLSRKTRAGILEHHFQYAENDLAVIDWNSAVLLEPSGQSEVADILEFAVSHLLELRSYDDLLDQRLVELYRAMEGGGRSDFRRLSAEANARYIEFSELVERIDNSLKVVGDFYLAVIFRGAVKRFRIQDWQGSVIRKMNLLARVSELLQGQANVQRGHLLEIIIIVLIAFEIVSTILKLY